MVDIFLKYFINLVTLQIGISVLTGMYSMLIMIMIMINGDEYLFRHKLAESHFILMGCILLMILTWLLAFIGAYRSSITIIGIAAVLWTICIVAWVGLSLLIVFTDNKKFCLTFETRCPPSLWLFENGRGSCPKLKPTAEKAMKTKVSKTKATSKNKKKKRDEKKLGKRSTLSVTSAAVNNFSKIMKMTTDYHRFGDDGTISQRETDFVHMDGLQLDHKKPNSLFPSQYDKNGDNDDGHRDTVDEKIDDNGDYLGDRNLEDSKINTISTVCYKYFVNNNHNTHRYVPVEKMYKHLMTIGFFLPFFLYSWFVLISYFMELKCFYECRCGDQLPQQDQMV